jgi:hypothetical protein
VTREQSEEPTGPKFLENDGERGCCCALVGKIWVIPGNCDRQSVKKGKGLRNEAVRTVQAYYQDAQEIEQEDATKNASTLSVKRILNRTGLRTAKTQI